MKNTTLIKVAFSILLAVIAGFITGNHSFILGINIVEIYDLIGKLFLNALTLVVVPLVVSSIISGSARLGAENGLGSLGSKTFAYFLLTSSLAVLVGYFCVTLISPGSSMTLATADFSAVTKATEVVIQNTSQEGSFAKISQILLQIVPSNILAAASQGQMLGLIPFCLLFGYFSTKIDPQQASVMLSFWNGLFQIMMKITLQVMRALPIGVFGLVAKVVATTGADSFISVAWFFATVVLAISIYMGILLPLLLKLQGLSPLAHFKAMAPALLTAFSTSSSAATLPIAIECIEKKAGVSSRISTFTLPLGASVNLSGTALHQCVVVFFIAQLYGIPLSLATQMIILGLCLVTTLGMAGIPSASLIAVVIILQTIGLPIEGVTSVLAVERFLDMFRTTASVFGNSCCALLIAKSEGEKVLLAATPIPQVTMPSEG